MDRCSCITHKTYRMDLVNHMALATGQQSPCHKDRASKHGVLQATCSAHLIEALELVHGRGPSQGVQRLDGHIPDGIPILKYLGAQLDLVAPRRLACGLGGEEAVLPRLCC